MHSPTPTAPLRRHLQELRSRLLFVSTALFGVAVFVFFFLSTPIFKVLARSLRLLNHEFLAHSVLIYTAPQEYFVVRLKISLAFALVLTLPLLVWHIYRFISPGLLPQERLFLRYMSFLAPLLFLCGALFAYFVVIPSALSFFFTLGQKAHIVFLPRTREWLSFTLSLLMSFGACFELPLILTTAVRLGFLRHETLKKNRKYAIIAIFIAAAFLTPPDIASQLLLAGPLLILYECSIIATRCFSKKDDSLS